MNPFLHATVPLPLSLPLPLLALAVILTLSLSKGKDPEELNLTTTLGAFLLRAFLLGALLPPLSQHLSLLVPLDPLYQLRNP
jgi:hypothetical protein